VDMRAVRQATSLGVSGKRARFCAGHREVAMLNVKDKTCELCGKQPLWACRANGRASVQAIAKSPC